MIDRAPTPDARELRRRRNLVIQFAHFLGLSWNMYRLAKSQGRLDELERTIIPPVEGTRGTSSWVNHFKGKTPKVL